MSYIQRELTDGERLILLGRLSWWVIVPRTVLAVAVLVVAVVVAVMLAVPLPLFLLIALPVVFVAWLVLVGGLLMRLFTTEIAITSKRVMSKTGWLRTEVKATPLDKVNNVNVTQSLFGNLLDYGDIEVTTATAEERDNHLISGLAHPDRFRNTLTDSAAA